MEEMVATVTLLCFLNTTNTSLTFIMFLTETIFIWLCLIEIIKNIKLYFPVVSVGASPRHYGYGSPANRYLGPHMEWDDEFTFPGRDIGVECASSSFI